MAAFCISTTLVSGFAGVGKSTLIENLRSLLKNQMVPLKALVVCDEGAEDAVFLKKVNDAIRAQPADVLLIESACDGEPFFGAELLSFGEPGVLREQLLRLDTLVTVIDTSRFIADVLASEDPVELGTRCVIDDERTVSEILIEQIEFADVIVLNKADLCDDALIRQTSALVERLNPRARILSTIRGAIAAEEVINAGLFDMEETDDGAGWLAQLQGEFEGVGIDHGVMSFTYKERRPFHPRRFHEMLELFAIEGLVRAKGSIWIASRHQEIGVWSLAGAASLLTYGGAWFAATPANEWPLGEEDRAEILEDWAAPFGDRRQEIAFIGIDFDMNMIRKELDACLMTSAEMRNGPDGWQELVDPLPDWHI